MSDGRDVVDRPPGPPLDEAKLPPWLRQFSLFLDVRQLGDELLAECLFCDLALAVPPDFTPSDNPETILNLARHGIQHAAAGQVRPGEEGGR
jgi:hypothetical protein